MADNLPHSYADVKKYGGLNLLERCGPVQACNATALHLSLQSSCGKVKTAFVVVMMVRR
jgi:hypothetical protein